MALSPNRLQNQRILFLSEYYSPHWTGIAQSTLNWCQHLKKNNEVSVLTTQYKPELPLQENIDGIRVIRTKSLLKFTRSFYSLEALFQLIKLVKRFDVVIIACPHINILFFSLILKFFKKPFIIFHHGDIIFPNSPLLLDRIKKRIIENTFDLLTHISMRLADSVCTYTLDYAENSRVLRRHLSKFTMVRPPIPNYAHEARSFDKETQLTDLKNSSYKIIGFAGRFVEEKGFDILFESIPYVIDKLPKCKFVFAGEVNMGYENFFEKNILLFEGIKEHLILLGKLDHLQMWRFYSLLDIFVLCSRSDCFALTQAEAAMCHTPIVVSDIPGARVLVKTTGFGTVVPPNDPRGLAEGIVRVLKNEKDYDFPAVEAFLNPVF